MWTLIQKERERIDLVCDGDEMSCHFLVGRREKRAEKENDSQRVHNVTSSHHSHLDHLSIS